MTNFALLTLQALASASSVFQCLSPLPSIYNAHKARHTGELSILPLVSLLGVCHIWCVLFCFEASTHLNCIRADLFAMLYFLPCRMMYGYLSGDIFPLCATYLFGDVVSILYVLGFYRYTSARKYTFQVIASVVSALLIVTVYAALGKLGVTNQSTDQVSTAIGFIGIAVSIMLYASPLETIKRVVTTKSASSIPILLCVVGTVSNALWTVYGLIIGDLFVTIPNAICLVLASIQVILYCIYNPNRQGGERQQGLVDLEKGGAANDHLGETTGDFSSTSSDSAGNSYAYLNSPRRTSA